MADPSEQKEKVVKEKKEKVKKEKVVKEKVAKASSSGQKKKDVKKETGLGLSVKKDENFGEWYSEVCLYVQR